MDAVPSSSSDRGSGSGGSGDVAEPSPDEPPAGAKAPEADEGSLARPNTNRDLRELARSHEHLSFHKEFNRYCDGCMRGKTRGAPHYKGAFHRKIKHFGSIITMDISTMTDAEQGLGIGGYKYALNIKSLFGKRFSMF